jgi:SAM-dependent methyltransferase
MNREAQTVSSTAQREGELWGARARLWGRQEDRQLPTYDEAIRQLDPLTDKRVLDVGCGAGAFLRLAADRGAEVCGLDASENLLRVARERVPEAVLEVGAMESLPFGDSSFDVVAGFNSFFFAADMVVALREAGRVARAGAPVLIQVWGRPERCEMKTLFAALAELMSASPPARPPLYEPGALEGLASEAGLRPERAFDHAYAWEYEDTDTLVEAMLSPGGIVEVVHEAGDEAVRDAIVESLARYQTHDGAYSIANEWHYLIARA